MFGQCLGLAGQQVSRPAVIGKPGRRWRRGIQDVSDEVIGELVPPAADYQQPGCQGPLTPLDRGGGGEFEHGAQYQRVQGGAYDGRCPEPRLQRRAGPAHSRLHRTAQRLRHPGVAAAQCSQHLDHEQGVAACPPQDIRGELTLSGGARELFDCLRIQRFHLEHGGDGLERCDDLRCLLGADGDDGEQPGVRQLAADEMQQFDGRLPGVLEVVDGEQHGGAVCQPAQQRRYRAKGAAAF